MFEILITLSASLEICNRFYQNDGGVLRLPVFVCFSQLLLYGGNLICEETFIVLLFSFLLSFSTGVSWNHLLKFFYSYLCFNVFSLSLNKIIMQIYTQLRTDNIFLGSHYRCFCHYPDSLRTSLYFQFGSFLNLVVIPVFIVGI